MKITFKYPTIEYVIRAEDFVEQISQYFNRPYYQKEIDMDSYIANIYVSDDNIDTIEYVGEEDNYYLLYNKDGSKTYVSKTVVLNSGDFIQAKLIEDDLIILQMQHYDYLSIIKGYSTIKRINTLKLDIEKDENIFIYKLKNIFKQEIEGLINCIDYPIKERAYNNEIEFTVQGQKYKTSQKFVFIGGKYKYIYVPSIKKVLVTSL